MMRGDDEKSGSLFSYRDVEDRVRANHRLRAVREVANAALAALSGGFARPYSGWGGRRSHRRSCCERPDAQLYRKGPGMEARLCYIGHGLMEKRSGLSVDARLTLVSGHTERLAAAP